MLIVFIFVDWSARTGFKQCIRFWFFELPLLFMYRLKISVSKCDLLKLFRIKNAYWWAKRTVVPSSEVLHLPLAGPTESLRLLSSSLSLFNQLHPLFTACLTSVTSSKCRPVTSHLTTRSWDPLPHASTRSFPKFSLSISPGFLKILFPLGGFVGFEGKVELGVDIGVCTNTTCTGLCRAATEILAIVWWMLPSAGNPSVINTTCCE